ncbi:anthranilate synthase component I family protein [Flavobacterium sp. D11R37]|uniref:anthranilate synthase component I family protein n=1 Tax=Flavobacterium coralii TaxID=2838017 RepID=UPI001CA658AA|nr:anthranilate synthase component I family protein [Flavobacterium coralii]MBY8961593.1 anthranilate synthase component I family protein [Flavobacterium coralii]
MRTNTTYILKDFKLFKNQLLQWSQQFREVVFLDGNDYHRKYTSFDAVLAVDAFTSIETDYVNAFAKLDEYQQVTKDWLFGYLSYDLKNDTEKLSSDNHDGLHFPDLFFFQPKKVFLIKGDTIELQFLNICEEESPLTPEGGLKPQGECDDNLLWKIFAGNEFETLTPQPTTRNPQLIQQRISHESYLDKANQMLAYIQRGDIYEANFCMEFYAEDAVIDPLQTYQKLNAISNPPFAAYFKNNKQYLLCASPERYLRKEGNKIISQPIKGTARRSSNAVEDESIKQELLTNEKERSENIMIVDLVRNDLSRTAAKGSVVVEELCGAYTFKQVHHLISTVSSQLKEGFTATDALKTTFPMGSMTGAPKISAMEIIEKLEETKRGLYSGALGYFTPEGDFDFNVVIRSILYNAAERYVSFSVGSAITAKADPEKEYEECLLKAKAMRSVLEQ